jgi:deoxyribodipyrimidine photo-lyase
MTTIVWFRRDLRRSDNSALSHAAARGEVISVYIHDDATGRPIGAASRWWLHHSLVALKKDLGGLVLLRGDPLTRLRELVRATGAEAVVWNRLYEPATVARDTAIKAALTADGLDVKSFAGDLLHEPWRIKTKSGGPFKVYTPFWRAVCAEEVATPAAAPKLRIAPAPAKGEALDDWRLTPRRPNWAAGWEDLWRPGEAGARTRLEAFLEQGLKGYGVLRNRPDLAHVSRLSPHLHFGEISPRQVWAETRFFVESRGLDGGDADKFLSELGWREFSAHLLHHFPTLPQANWKPGFDAYPWRDSAEHLDRWKRGETGYPFVDAAMRELWRTGYMHNRARMVAASFLVKHLRIHWREGEAWFWDTLVDADLANNAAGWQWVAGSGADAAPYFRIFNPVTQGRKFDADGAYVRRWIPELSRLDDRVIHAPFEASAAELAKAGVRLGETYPAPIVNHAKARAAALAGYDAVKAAENA